jgi:hypothetical protein
MRGFLYLLLFIPFSAVAQLHTVLVGNEHEPEEVSIAINPKTPLQMAAGANLDNCYYSTDGGLHWTGNKLISPGNGVYGDPCLFTDTSGAFYFMHLSFPPPGNGSWVDRIVCHRSADGGQTYAEATYTGKNGSKVQDKPWTSVDPLTNEIYVCWTQFDIYGSRRPEDSTVILFSKSADGAQTWSKPLRIGRQAGDCIDSDSTVEGAVPAAGPEGQVYVAWAGPQGLVFTKSNDRGITWLPHESVICSLPGGWDYPISGLYRANGLPWTVCDLSTGPHRGTIYINWSDQRKGTSDTDVWLVKSSDGGDTWSAPIRVNTDPPGKQNFMSSMCIDQSNGNLYVVYYDRRACTGDTTDVYLSRSTDGGETFRDYKVNTKSFVPNTKIFFGDYITIAASNNKVRPIWMAYEDRLLSVWTAIADGDSLEAIDKQRMAAPSPLLETYSPWLNYYGYGRVSIEVKSTEPMSAYVVDANGKRLVAIFENQVLPLGRQEYLFHAKAAQVPPGEYTCQLVSGKSTDTFILQVH